MTTRLASLFSRPALLRAILLLGVGALAGCRPRQEGTTPQPQPLRVLCGSSMATPVQELVHLFESNHGSVLLDLGGSETLLPRILSGAPADIFVCHDPFETKIREAGKLAGSVEVGQLRPVVLVRPGNPQGLHRLEDLARPGLKLGIGDPRFSTCGEMFVNALKEKGLYDPAMRNVVLQGRTHTEIANGLILGPLDAAAVWNFVARLYADKVEEIAMPYAYPPVRVTVLGLSTSANPALRDAFLDLCRSTTALAIFDQHGYGPTAPAGSQ